MKALLILPIFLVACSPRFTTTNPNGDQGIQTKAEPKLIFGSWLYTLNEKAFKLTIRLDLDAVKIRFTENCLAANNETTIQTTSRAFVAPGKISLVDVISGQMKNGELNCGMDFRLGEYPVTLKGNTLTLQTATGPMAFERITP